MVVVQPIQLVTGQDARNDGRGVDGNIHHRLEGQELAVLVGRFVVALQLVLDADADHAAFVDARLIGDDHARLEDDRVAAVQGVRAFVDIADEADAVAGAAAVVDEVLPQRFTGDGIQHVAIAVVQPDSLCDVDMALDSPSVEQLLVLGQLTQRIGTGDIGSAVHIGRAAVHQQEALALQLCVVGFGRMVVHHGGVRAVSSDGVEALDDELVLCAAVLVQDLVDGQLSQLFTGSHPLFQLLLEANHRDAVADVCFTDVCQLDLVLDALHRQQRVSLVLDGQGSVLGEGLVDLVVDACRIDQNSLRLGDSGHIFDDIIVLGQLDAVFLQLCGCLRFDTGGVDKQRCLVGGDIAERQSIRSAVDVHCAQVQQPCQIVQLADELCGAAQFLQLCAELIQLLCRGEACVLFAQDPSRSCRQLRAALDPQLIFQMQGLDGAVLCVQSLLQAAHQTAGGGETAQAQSLALVQSICAVFLDGRNARLAHLLQFNFSASQLLFSLHEEAAIRPQCATGTGHNEVGVLAGEAGEILTGVVVGRQVLAGMWVTGRDDIGGAALCLHCGAQSGDAFIDSVHAHETNLLSYSTGKTSGGGGLLYLIVASLPEEFNRQTALTFCIVCISIDNTIKR